MPSLQASILTIAALATLAMSVDITLYPNSVSCLGAGSACLNIAAGQCCSNGPNSEYYSVLFNGLDTTGVPDFGTVYAGNLNVPCASACNSGGGSAAICLEPGSCPSVQGAEWFNPTSGKKRARGAAVNAKRDECVKPNQAFFANGKAFQINYDVPANITSLVHGLIVSDPNLSAGIPDEMLPYEVVVS